MAGMKAKAIKSVLSRKFKELLASIDDEPTRKALAEGTIITGGCIASMLLGEPVNDFDMYFRNRETALTVAKYYVGKFTPGARKGIPCKLYVDEAGNRVRIVVQSAGIASEVVTEKPYTYFETAQEDGAGEYVSGVLGNAGDIEEKQEELQAQALETPVQKPPYRPVFMSTNAITLADKVQLVLRFFGEPDVIHENYDFVHCTSYWTSWDAELVLRQDALESLLAKELKYVGSKYPVCSLVRLRKFIKRGFTINAGQILKIAMQVSALDLTNPSVLQDQLSGMDAAYFIDILRRVKEKYPDKINSAYLCEVIDRMF